jgi:hypothetical protein
MHGNARGLPSSGVLEMVLARWQPRRQSGGGVVHLYLIEECWYGLWKWSLLDMGCVLVKYASVV